MEKLNELVEQAKFIADWHGSDWSSALCQKKDGKQAHEIICESRGESVISTGSNSNEASWLCDYLELCSPENILTIAESFRELEQRAEAAEAKLAELAELEKQEPVAWHIYQWRESTTGWGWYLTKSFSSKPQLGDGWKSVPLFTRPAPAADLPNLSPVRNCLAFFASAIRSGESWSSTCQRDYDAALSILRKIEEAK